MNIRKRIAWFVVISVVVLLIIILTAWKVSSDKQEESQTVSYYYICYEDPNIRYYDREFDLVFDDAGKKWCKEYTIKKGWTMPTFIHESGTLDNMVFESTYSDRVFDRTDYDSWRYVIVE